MHCSKLFRALVIGGGMTAAALTGCGDEAATAPQANGEMSSEVSENETSTDEATATDTSGEVNEGTAPEDSTDDVVDDATPDESEDSSSEDTSSSEANAGENLAPCFCGTEPDCCEEVDGEAQATDGFECCWGTSC